MKPHSIIRELDFQPPRAVIHTFKYEHEKACADVFVTLALTGKLYGWELHKKIAAGIIPDRIALMDTPVYIEVEMGSQKKIRQKAENYRRYFNDTKEIFSVWFLVKKQKTYEDGLEDLRGFTSHYAIELLDDFNKLSHSDTLSDTRSD